MSISCSPTQTLILWLLIAKGGEGYQKDMKPEPSRRDRQALENAGLITSEPRERRAIWIEVTDAGWAWANDNRDAELPLKTQSAGPILPAWLTHLPRYMKRRGVALADIMSDVTAPDKPIDGPTKDIADTLTGRIRSAYLNASQGAWNKRVHLHELRRILNDVPRPELDQTLLNMQSNAELMLFGLDDKQEITPADRSAAIQIGGEPRHVLRMGG